MRPELPPGSGPDAVRGAWMRRFILKEEYMDKIEPLPTRTTGYEPLAAILAEALAQASTGKGRERHANGRPFHEQPIMQELRAVGLGFAAGQARKKILEACRCHQQYPDRAIADLLGAINYAAATILRIREIQGGE